MMVTEGETVPTPLVGPEDDWADVLKQTSSAAIGGYLAASVIGAAITPAVGLAVGAAAIYLLGKQVGNQTS